MLKERIFELLITRHTRGETDESSLGTRLIMAAREIETGEESDLHSPNGTRLTVGLYEDSLPGEFMRMAKEGSTVSGLMDSFAIAVSLALQYGALGEAPLGISSATRGLN